jgi:hypothetical protein
MIEWVGFAFRTGTVCFARRFIYFATTEGFDPQLTRSAAKASRFCRNAYRFDREASCSDRNASRFDPEPYRFNAEPSCFDRSASRFALEGSCFER